MQSRILLFLIVSASLASADGPVTANLVVSASLETQAALSWTASSGATSYDIYRGTSPGHETLLASHVQGTTFEDTSLDYGATYYYKVAAVDGSQAGRFSPEASVLTKTGKPNSTITCSAGDAQVALTWPAAPGATGYRIYRDTLGAPSGTDNFLVTGSETYTDTGLLNGTTYYYEVDAINASGENEAYEAVGKATPNGPYRTSPNIGPVATNPSLLANAPLLKAVSGKDQIVLTWTGDGNSYAIYRVAAGAENLLNSGVTGHTFTDAGPPNGTTYSYKVQALNADGSGVFSNETSATASGLSALPETIIVHYGLPDEPVQSCSVYLPDLHRPVQGALFFSMGRMGRHLQAVIDKYNIAVFSTGNFAFVTAAGSHVALTTTDDKEHTVQVIDYRWPERSAQRIQAALTAATAQIGGHPEIQYTGLVMYGFSEGCCNVNLAVAQPALAHRILAVIQLSELDEDHYGPISVMDTAPHLFLSSGYTSDPYSALNRANPDYTDAHITAATYDDEGRGLATNQGAPLTIVDNAGVGHGGNPDNPFIGIWLDDVLSQRLPATVADNAPVSLPDWKNGAAWVGTYNVALTNNPPWGTATIKGVQLTEAAIGPRTSHTDPRPFTWLPSQNTARVWLSYMRQGTIP